MNRLKLATEAGDLIFISSGSSASQDCFDFIIQSDLDQKYSRFFNGDFDCRFYRKDLERLISYFKSHMMSLISGEAIGEFAYMPLEGDIQITCLEGEGEDLRDGYFSLMIMFNCGAKDEVSSNCYFGLESIVYFSSIREFCHELEVFLS